MLKDDTLHGTHIMPFPAGSFESMMFQTSRLPWDMDSFPGGDFLTPEVILMPIIVFSPFSPFPNTVPRPKRSHGQTTNLSDQKPRFLAGRPS